MNKFLIKIFILFFLFINQSIAQENIMILKLKDGDVKIELFEDVAPNHVKRIKELADSGQYNDVVFHRVAYHMIEALFQWQDHLIQTLQIVNSLYVLNQHLS